MKNLFKSITLLSIIFFIGCSNEDPVPEKEELEIPKDKSAFYMFEGFSERVDLHTVTRDSINLFVKRFIDYQDIISYDTSTFEYEVTGVSKINLDSLMAGNGIVIPVLAIWEAKGLLELRFPPTGISQDDPDPRFNTTMLEIFSSEGKLVE